jgi:predicted choloylglycine hydrolase
MEYHKSRRYCREGVTVVILRGSPYELGYARGVLLREEIQAWARESLSEIEQQRSERNLDQESLKENITRLEAAIPTEFKAELEGMAASSGVDYSTLLQLNVWSNVDAGCTSVAVIGHDGKLLRSRNYDWLPIRLLLPPVLSIYQPDNGYGFMSVHAPGIIGVATGMNEKGITFGSHTLPGGKHDGKGLPSGTLNRLILQYSGSIEDAEKMLNGTPRGIPRLWLLTSAENAFIYEFDSRSVHREGMMGGTLVLTNHGRNLNLRESSPSSIDRFNYVRKYLADNAGKIDVMKLVDLNRDELLSSYGQGSAIVNLHSVIFAPATLEFWVAIGPVPATKGRWVGFSLSKELYRVGLFPDPAVFEAVL